MGTTVCFRYGALLLAPMVVLYVRTWHTLENLEHRCVVRYHFSVKIATAQKLLRELSRLCPSQSGSTLDKGSFTPSYREEYNRIILAALVKRGPKPGVVEVASIRSSANDGTISSVGCTFRRFRCRPELHTQRRHVKC